jgi:hypothetical protein
MASLEIVDAIQTILDREGSLGEVKANLRSKVLKILTQEAADIVPNAASEFIKQDNGKVSMSLVVDLLSSLNMKNTLKIFEAESGVMSGKLNRDDLRKELSLSPNAGDNGQSMPILEALVSRGAVTAPPSDSPLSSSNSTQQQQQHQQKVPSGGNRQPRSSTNSPTSKSPESADSVGNVTGRRSLSPHTLLPVDGGKGLGARRAISLQISPKAEIPVPTGQSPNPKSPTALSPMPVSPSAAAVAAGSDPLGRMPSVENRSRMGRDLTPLMPISPTSASSPSAADTVGPKSVFRIGGEGALPESESSLKQSSPRTSSPAAPEVDKPEAKRHIPQNKSSDGSSRPDSPTTLGVEAGTIREQKTLHASKPLNPVSTNVVNVRSTNKRTSRGDATALRLSGGATTRSSRGWNNDDRNSDADFDFGENERAAGMQSLSQENPVIGSRRLSPLENRANRSPTEQPSSNSPNVVAAGSTLENLEDEDDVGEISMRSNQQDDDAYDDDYEDEFEDVDEDLSPKQESSPSPKKGSLFTNKFAAKDLRGTDEAAAKTESGDEFEDAFDDSFEGDQAEKSPLSKEKSTLVTNKETSEASWGTKGNKEKEIRKASSPKQDEEVILQDLDESVASEEIEDFEMSVADNSDSFSFLNESTNSQKSKNMNRGGRVLNTSHASEGSTMMDFSVDEREVSGDHSTGLSEFDHTVKALPPLRNQKL